MKIAIRTLSLIVVAVLCAGLGRTDDLDTFIREQMALRQIPGLSLAIILDGRIVEARAYGVATPGGAAVTTSTLFQAGSISKPAAAAGALRLRSLTYLMTQDVAGRNIERHGAQLARVLFYRADTDNGSRWLMVQVTADGLIADYDVVQK